ncbi:cytosolic Fe-S cluster assembly factor cfd1 [Schaereria dolodes]|nr:cytosolic Fe-S cluster assembly factor cfd1 [Schaereria dolodes]
MSLDNVKNIVLVLSGKGGVGKSSITTQLALSLSLAGRSVGILDIDLTGPSIPRLLGIESAKVKQAPGGWLPVEVHPSQILPSAPLGSFSSPFAPLPLNGSSNGTNGTTSPPLPTFQGTSNGITASSDSNTGLAEFQENHALDETATVSTSILPGPTQQIGSLHAMSLAFLLTNRSSAVVWRGPKKTAMVRQFLTSVLWPPVDYLLIDTPPGTSDEHISLVETLFKSVSTSTGSQQQPNLAGAVIVTTPQAVAISDVRKEINFCSKVGVKVLGVVENMSGYVCECCGVGTNLFGRGGGEVMSKEFGVDFLGRVPLDGQWGLLVEEGRRPTYGAVANGGGREDDVDDSDDEVDGHELGEQEDITNRGRKEEGLLVDKYRSCSLCPVFEDIARQVIETIEKGAAVQVGV